MHTQEQATPENHIAAVRARKSAEKHLAVEDALKLAASLRSQWNEAHRTTRDLGLFVADLDRRIQVLLSNSGDVRQTAGVLAPKFREALELAEAAQAALASLLSE